MKTWELLGETSTPDGSHVRLTRQENEYVILVDGKTLMSSRRHGSEDALAAFGCRHLQSARKPHVLVGGLGMGFTLRASLDALPPAAIVTVVELLPAVVEWNRGPLGSLAGYPLKDSRVRVELGDVRLALQAAPRARLGAILLDVDNGPAAFTAQGNGGLYRQRRRGRGLRRTRRRRGAGGVVCARGSEVRAAPAVPRLHRARRAGAGPSEEGRPAPHALSRRQERTPGGGRLIRRVWLPTLGLRCGNRSDRPWAPLSHAHRLPPAALRRPPPAFRPTSLRPSPVSRRGNGQLRSRGNTRRQPRGGHLSGSNPR